MVHGSNRKDRLLKPFRIFELNYSTALRSFPTNSKDFVYQVAGKIVNKNQLVSIIIRQR